MNGRIVNPENDPIPKDISIDISADKSSNPIPFPPLYIIKNEFNINVNPTNMGNDTYALSKLFSLLKTVNLVIKNIVPATIAENIGDKNHDNIIPETPPIYGKISTLPWAVIFPNGGPTPRHPSQIYEAILEGLILFIIRKILSNSVIIDLKLAHYFE